MQLFFKRKLLAPALLTVAFGMYLVTDSIIQRLGMQEQTARMYIIKNLVGRWDTGPMDGMVEDGPANSVYKQLQSFQVPRARLLADIINGDKAGAARELCEYVKKYVNSEEFMADYEKLRMDALPLTANGMPLSTLLRNKEVFEANIRNYPNDTKYVADQTKQKEENQVKINQITEGMKKPFPGKTEWEKMYPADPAAMIKARLQEYLSLVATVDFSAKLTGTGRKQTFVNPVYEKKSLKWKAIYRAGKEVNDVVTAFVKDWIKSGIMQGAKTKMDVAAATNSPAAPAKPVAQTNSPATAATENTAPASAPATGTTPAPAAETEKPKKSLLNKLKKLTGN